MNTRRLLSIILFLVMVSYQNHAQSTKGNNIFNEETLAGENANVSVEQLNQSEKFAAGNIVNAEDYYIGPGDLLSIQVLNVSAMPTITTVSPEVTIMLPRIGEIILKNKTLAEARQLITDRIKQINPAAQVFIGLQRSRNIIVTFLGNSEYSGVYTLPASYRLSTALKIVSRDLNLNMNSDIIYAEKVRYIEEQRNQTEAMKLADNFGSDSYLRRYIVVKHNDGSTTLADLDKALSSGITKLDPFLREGDEIYIPNVPEEYPSMSITGEIINPGVFAFKTGDKISDLLKFAKGLTPEADINSVFIAFPNEDNTRKISIDSKLNILSDDLELVAGCKVVVGRIKTDHASELGTVTIQGSVVNPNVYIIKNNQTRLKDIIEKAGGFTDNACLSMSYVLRNKESFGTLSSRKRRSSEFLRNSNLTLQDTTRFALDELYKLPIVSCDFVKLFKYNSNTDNITLLDGDRIIVSSAPKDIYVYGQVNNPGWVPYVSGKDYKYYINQAGGYADNASKGRTSIIRGINRVWLECESDMAVEAGDFIYVPRPPDLPPGVEMQNYAVIASSVASLIAVINFFIYIFK